MRINNERASNGTDKINNNVCMPVYPTCSELYDICLLVSVSCKQVGDKFVCILHDKACNDKLCQRYLYNMYRNAYDHTQCLTDLGWVVGMCISSSIHTLCSLTRSYLVDPFCHMNTSEQQPNDVHRPQTRKWRETCLFRSIIRLCMWVNVVRVCRICRAPEADRIYWSKLQWYFYHCVPLDNSQSI